MDQQSDVVAAGTDLVSLRLLAAIAQLGSIAAAGRRVGISQQAASVRIARLEATLRLPLLERTPRGSRLTKAGSAAATWATEVVAAADRFVAGVTALRNEGGRPFAVAASLTVAEYLLPRWLVALRELPRSPRSPGWTVSVTAANSERVLELVADGSHQVGFIESPVATDGFTVTTVARDELVVVVAPAHPWARRQVVSAALLARTPLVARELGSGTRLYAQQLLTDAGHPPVPPLVEFPTTAAVRTAVAAGAGPAILSILAVGDDLATGRLVRLRVNGIRFLRDLRAVSRTGPARRAQTARFLEVVAGLQSR